MSLANLVTDLVSTAFDILDDMNDSATYIEQTGNAYDPDTGMPTKTEVEYIIPKCILAQFTQREKEKDETINGTTDVKLIYPRKGQTFTADDNDVVRDSSNNIWDIVKAVNVPGDSLGILHLRRR